jgi:hypothetical protein
MAKKKKGVVALPQSVPPPQIYEATLGAKVPWLAAT